MTTQFTPILQLALPVTGELNGTWGDVVNDNITSMIEQAIAGKADISTWVAASHTLTTADGTTDEARCAMLECTGAPGAAAEVICPARTKLYVINNLTTGGYAVTLKTPSGTGIAVPNGKAMLLYCDGTNVVQGVDYVASAANAATADKWTTARNLAGNSVDGSANVQFANKFVVQGTSDSGLSGAQFLGALGTGLVKNTTTTGVLSIAASGTDYAPATSGTSILKGNGSGGFSSAVSGTDYAPATSGTSILYGNGTGGFSNVTIGSGVSFAGGTLSATGSGGTVTSVTGTSPVASSGGATPAISLSSGYGDTQNPYASKTQNYVLAAPNGSSGAPSFRALVAADIPSLSYVSSVSGTSPIVSSGGTTPAISIPAANGTTNGYLTSADWTTFNSKQPAGTYVTAVSVASANGFAGSSSGGATPSLTLSTSITGVLKGNGTAISAATAGTDYAPATSGTSILKGNGAGGFNNAAAGTDYAPATSGTSILYGNGSGGFSNVTVSTGLSFVGGTLSATGGMTYPSGTGIAVVTSGSSWGTTLAAPTGTIVGTTDTQTLTNKWVQPRVLASTADSATPTLNTDNYDMMVITGQTNAITSFTTNLTGTPVNGQKLWIAITGTGAIAITWGASFESSTVTLPTTTVTTNRLDVGFVWNAATSKWRCVATA